MNPLFNITTPEELAAVLDIPYRKMTHIVYGDGEQHSARENKFYTAFTIPKKDGTLREIHAPNDELKGIQRKIASALVEGHRAYLEEKGTQANISHAFEKEKSIMTNAAIHRNKRFVVNIDLEDFFGSFHFGRVFGFFMHNKEFLMGEDAARLLANICCYKSVLPQGAPTSPIIANLIANILDMNLVPIARKYRLQYTRYADDLTFSTNDKKFLQKYGEFLLEVKIVIEKSGYRINEKKTRLQYKDSRQEVTGLVVNEKLSVPRNYYKKTRAMAYELYKNGVFYIDGRAGTMNELEGRFSFINQIDKYNNQRDGKKHDVFRLNGREKEYQCFLFYRYFYANEKNMIVTEGKTDVIYIKAALRNYYDKYPKLISKTENGFEYHISFLKRSKRLQYFLGIVTDGADAVNNIFQFYKRGGNMPDLYEKIRDAGAGEPQRKVILLFDNEEDKGKPLKKFLKNIGLSYEEKYAKHAEHVIANLYLLTCPKRKGKKDSEIEDLFDEEMINQEIDGRMFDRKVLKGDSNHYGKNEFANYVMGHYEIINMERFIPMLDAINEMM